MARTSPGGSSKRKKKSTISGSVGKRKAPREAHVGAKMDKNQPFKVKAWGGAARPPKPGAGRPQGGATKRKPAGVGGRNKKKKQPGVNYSPGTKLTKGNRAKPRPATRRRKKR